jgi:DNA-binding beta-propeller fold protein YncE
MRYRTWLAGSVACAAGALAAGCSEDERSAERPGSGSVERPGRVPERPSNRERSTYSAAIALERQSAVAIVTGPPWRLRRTVRVPAGPHNVSASAQARLFAVTSPPSGRVTLLRPNGGVAAVARIAGAPHDSTFTRDGRWLWVTAERAGQLVRVDTRTGRVTAARRVGGPPHDVRLSPDGRELWLTVVGTSRVQVRSAMTGRLRAAPDLGGAPHDLAFEPRTGRIWLTNFSSPRLTAASVRMRRRVGGVTAGTEPHHFAFGGSLLWVSDNAAASVARIDPKRRSLVARTRVGTAPHHLAAAGSTMLVAVHGRDELAVLSRDGGVRRRIRVGDGPHGVAVLGQDG